MDDGDSKSSLALGSTPIIGEFVNYVYDSGLTRLGNCLRAADAQNLLPYPTLEEFLAADEEERRNRMHKVPNVGEKTIGELLQAAAAYIEYRGKSLRATPASKSDQRIDERVVRNAQHLIANDSIFYTYVQANGSVRLTNVLEKSLRDESFPYQYVEDLVELQEHSVLVALRGLPNAGSKTANELVRLAYEFLEEPESLETKQPTSESFVDVPLEFEELLAPLDKRQREVIERRFGLVNAQIETLESIGELFGVTRERIRQIESKALKSLKGKWNKPQWLRYVEEHEEEVLECLFGVRSFLRSAPKITGKWRLALTVTHGSVERYLESRCDEWEGSYVRPGTNYSGASEAAAYLQSADKRIPISLKALSEETRHSVSDYTAAILGAGDFALHRGYLVRVPKTARKKRVANILRLFDHQLTPSPCQLWDLKVAYWLDNEEDHCSGRDLLLSLADHPAHFENLRELGWARINNGTVCVSERRKGAPSLDEFPGLMSEIASEPVRNSDGLANRIFKMFDQYGPMRLKTAASKFTELFPQYSKASIYPMLVNFAVFLRLAPGVVGIQKHLQQGESVAQARQILLDGRQIDLYLLSLQTGEPTITYPLWDSEMERSWCEWAFEVGDNNRLGRLLSLVDLECWTLPEKDKDWWRSKKATDSIPPLPIEPAEIEDRFVELDMLRKALCAASVCGSTNWMHVNQALGWRIETRRVATVLALLIHLGALYPTGSWTERHSLTVRGTELLKLMLSSLSANELVLQPDSDAELGWAAKWDFAELLSRVTDSVRAVEPDLDTVAVDDDEIDDLYESILRDSLNSWVEELEADDD